MASANVYTGRFIGNDIVVPKKSQTTQIKKQTEEILVPIAPVSTVLSEQFEAPSVQQESVHRFRLARPSLPTVKLPTVTLPFTQIKLISLVFALLISAALLCVGVIVALQNNLLGYFDSSLSSVQQGINARIHPVANISLPPNSVAVKSENQTSFVNKINNQLITIAINGDTVLPSQQDISKWFKVTPNFSTDVSALTADPTAIMSYLTTISNKYIQAPIDQLTVTHPDGTTVTLINGRNGVSFPGLSAVSDQIMKNLFSGGGMNLSVPAVTVPFKSLTQPSQPKFIEVDLTKKRLYAYQNGSIVKTLLVSAGAPATPTVTGQFQIYAKYLNQTMQGENADGTNYLQPNVQYVNYFYKDYAIHGNYWRPVSYFGNVNSSHGCVGLLDSDAAWVYNWAPVGTTVLTHN